MIRWPAGLDPEAFLGNYWQRKPLLLPGGLPELPFKLSPEELAGLACEPDVEARLVSGGDGRPWSLRHGPFSAADFRVLPETGWTLLVQDVDKHLPETAVLLDAFDFLPRWRVDDVMISYAAPGGGVGPHVDAYDVFLLQATGRRRWSLDPAPADLAGVADAPLKLLRRFEPVTELELASGDILYLPPGVAHRGLGDVPCVTVSIGFRAPAAAELTAALALALDRDAGERLYHDAGLAPGEAAGRRISPAAVERARALILDGANGELMIEALGRSVTRPKPGMEPAPADAPAAPGGVTRRLAGGGRLRRHGYSRFAWHATGDALWLFADGEAWRLSPTLHDQVHALCESPVLDANYLAVDGETARRTAALLAGLLDNGSLEWENGDHRREPAERDET